MPIAVNDTLACDTSLLKYFKEAKTYDYGAELRVEDEGFLEWFFKKIGNALSKLWDNTIGDNGNSIALCIVIFLIIIVVYLFIRYKPFLFGRVGRKQMEYDVTEDTIYGIDFDTCIEKAINSAEYNEAIRLMFLKTLRWLSDRELINWQIYKTPTQYVKEVGTSEFRQLTNIFIRVRYGNFNATTDTVSAVRALQQQIMKEGEV